ncbi:phosphonate ABC transporter ATP-binding protein [Paenibacillus thalictri]|uniref:ATP-binding cassette domain-containing protein n=1 Tax=Paenibacillus thalictri TaxID=2527873 RepID=A0A4Q9DVG3_9BACL|nr:ATP-binding cassette domain-containing protein [Paenibacillus thalictri]TBL80355.1 ATP-binding cassette domain-containing protein [Paenibacillus thalictri]
MIIVRNLTKTFPATGQEVLSRISFQVDQGELVGLVGSSGTGKTTLLRCLSLKESWTSGQYIYDSKDITQIGLLEKWKQQRHWAYLEEKPALNRNQSAYKNVLPSYVPYWRAMLGLVSTDERVTVMDYLERVGLLDQALEKAEKLSGGEQQRVAVAKALLRGAKVIFADEPVSGLDPEAAENVMKDLKHICVKEKVTIICIMHQLELAEKYASRIWGLNEGRMVVDIAGRRLTQREKNLIFS